jgi:hypothetical protein
MKQPTNLQMIFLRRFVLAALTVLGATSLHQPATATSQASPNISSRCTAYTSGPWVPRPGTRSAIVTFKVEAFSDGPTCEKAVIVYVVRNQNGQVLFEQSHQSQFVLTTAGARTRAQMAVALREWVGSNPTQGFYDNLPDWKAGAQSPEPKEFGFTPDTNISRADYIRIKSSRPPVRCYVQGMESLNCLVLEQGRLSVFGVQAFPG